MERKKLLDRRDLLHSSHLVSDDRSLMYGDPPIGVSILFTGIYIGEMEMSLVAILRVFPFFRGMDRVVPTHSPAATSWLEKKE